MQHSDALGAAGGASCDGAPSPSQEVALIIPDGLPEPTVTVSFRPGTHEEFEAVVDGYGGPGAFEDCGTFAFVHVSEMQTVHLHPPKNRPQVPLRDPFMVAFAQRIGDAKAAEERAA